MDLLLSFEVFDFFFKAGVTSATFKSDGKIQFSTQKSMFLCKSLTNISEFFFGMFVGVSFCCVVVAVSSSLISSRTSSKET